MVAARSLRDPRKALLPTAITCWFVASAAGEQAIPDRSPDGVRHIITASVGVDPSYQKVLYGDGKELAGTALVRISDHAQESQFYGHVPVAFAGVSADKLAV